MILEKSTPWGRITGKLSLTPKQAKEMLGYTMKPGALGVVLQIINGKQVVRSLMPQRKIKTDEVKANEGRWGIVTHMSHEHQKDLIVPIWNKAKEKIHRKEIRHGTNLFISTNCLRLGMPPCWEKLLISTGEVDAPEFRAEYCPSHKIVIIKPTKETHWRVEKEGIEIRVGIFDSKAGELHHPVEHLRLEHSNYQDFIVKQEGKKAVQPLICVRLPFVPEERWRKNNPIVFVYLKKGDEYSESRAVTLEKRCEKYVLACGKKEVSNRHCPVRINPAKPVIG